MEKHEFDHGRGNSSIQVADFRHLTADIGQFLMIRICMGGVNILLLSGFRPQMKFGTVVAPVVQAADTGTGNASVA